jgi:signal transduction histidine kinase
MVGSKIEILLVEDNRADARLIEELLKEVEITTFVIDFAENLADVKSIIKEKTFDVILLDLGLPDSHGLETVVWMNKCCRHTPIIVLTGFDDEKTGIDSIKNGAQDYLIKGNIDPNMLSRTIMYCIEREQIKIQLSESNSMKELLLDIIAHDLKNPAGVIKGFADFGIKTDPENEFLQEIQDGINSLLKVIDNTTVLSKVASGDEVDKKAINITEMINTISKEFAPLLESEKMKLDLKLQKNTIVSVNPIISEVFRNYISNAIKYANKGKKIIIDMKDEDGILTVNVIDHGTTIARKDRINIFKRNVQLGYTNGSGLGLAIVKRIADAHNAEVGIKPNNQTGNIFYIRIPQ